MVDLFPFWPLNIESGPVFLFFYAVFSIFSGALLLLVRREVGEWLDERSSLPTEEDDVSPGAALGAGIYRAVVAPEAPGEDNQHIEFGTIPRGDKCWTVAYLSRGVGDVTDAMIITSLICGSVVIEPNTTNLRVVAASGNRLLDDILGPMVQVGPMSAEQLRGGIGQSLWQVVDRFQAELGAANLLRSDRTKTILNRMMTIGLGFIVLVGILRALRGALLNHPIGLLVAEILLAATGIGIGWSVQVNESSKRKAYVAWLGRATMSVVYDVSTGRRTQIDEVMLALAAAGARSMCPSAFRPIVYPPPPRPFYDGSSGSSGFSCSSSSSTSSCGGSSSSCGGGSSSGGGGSGCGG